jgi:hypothetical protein
MLSLLMRYGALTCYFTQKIAYVGQHLLARILDIGFTFEIAKLQVGGGELRPWVVERLGEGSAGRFLPFMVERPRRVGLHKKELALPVMDRARPTLNLLSKGWESGPKIVPAGGCAGRDDLKDLMDKATEGKIRWARQM